MDTLNRNILIVHNEYLDETKVIDLDRSNLSNVLFSFNEHSTISLELKSLKYNISIENYSYYHNNIYYESEDNILKLENNETYIISKNQSDEVNYIPDRYKIYVSHGNEVKEYFFEVKSNKEVTNDGLKTIANNLNNFIEGLAYDYLKKAKGKIVGASNNGSEVSVFDFVERNEKKLHQHATLIRENIKASIQTVYKKELVEKKQNQHTIRLNQCKIEPNKYYNVKKVPQYNLKENIQLKYYLTNIKKILVNRGYDFKDSIERKIAKESEIENQIEEEKQKLTLSQNKSNKIMIANSIKNLEENLKENKKWIKKLNRWNESLFTTINTLNSLISNEELNKLPIEFINGDLFNSYNLRNYRFFQDYYKILINGLSGSSMLNEETTGYRRSYLLFELYGFIIIQSILLDLGYTITNPIANSFDFNSDSKFEFVKEDKKIVVLYDHYCKKYHDVNESQMVSINSHHSKPDFIIMYYDNNTLKKVNIIDMKYRYLNNLNDQGTTEIDTILEDYKQLKYYDSCQDKCREIVEEVIIIYPKAKEEITKRYMGLYAGININYDRYSSNTYKILKSIIE